MIPHMARRRFAHKVRSVFVEREGLVPVLDMRSQVEVAEAEECLHFGRVCELFGKPDGPDCVKHADASS